MSAIRLRKKVELGLVSYLKSIRAGTALRKYDISVGSSAVETRTLPAVVIACGGLEDAWAEGMPKNADVAVFVYTSFDCENDDSPAARARQEALHEEAAAVIEAGMQDLDGLQAHLNKANVTNRPVEDFYLYDVSEAGQDSVPAPEERHYADVFRYTVLCEAQDN